MMDIQNEIQMLAHELLAENTDPILKYKLLKEVIGTNKSEMDLEISKAIADNKWVQILKSEQWKDGSWGRFHSRDTQKKQVIYTTELGVRKALLLGLDIQHPIIKNALRYLTKNFSLSVCPDPPEKNERWPVGVKLFFASTIAIIDPDHKSLNSISQSWFHILEKSFESGYHNVDHEEDTYRNVFGLTEALRYLHLNSKYHLEFYSRQEKKLGDWIIRAYIDWLWKSNLEIQYLGMKLTDYKNLKRNYIYHWLEAMRSVLKFRYRNNATSEAIKWLWSQKNEQGLWDFGPVADNYYKLSSNWRNNNRLFDCSTLVLSLLTDYLKV